MNKNKLLSLVVSLGLVIGTAKPLNERVSAGCALLAGGVTGVLTNVALDKQGAVVLRVATLGGSILAAGGTFWILEKYTPTGKCKIVEKVLEEVKHQTPWYGSMSIEDLISIRDKLKEALVILKSAIEEVGDTDFRNDLAFELLDEIGDLDPWIAKLENQGNREAKSASKQQVRMQQEQLAEEARVERERRRDAATIGARRRMKMEQRSKEMQQEEVNLLDEYGSRIQVSRKEARKGAKLRNKSRVWEFHVELQEICAAVVSAMSREEFSEQRDKLKSLKDKINEAYYANTIIKPNLRDGTFRKLIKPNLRDGTFRKLWFEIRYVEKLLSKLERVRTAK